MKRIVRLARKLCLQLCSLPLKLLPIEERAETLEDITVEMTRTVQTSRGVIEFVCSTPLLHSRAVNLLTKEPDTIKWLESFEEDAVLWDVGANVGVFTLYAALSKGTEVCAFEPGAANYHVLCRNIQLNHLPGTARAYCLAFSCETRLGVLNMASADMGAAINQFGNAGEVSRFAGRDGRHLEQGMIGYAVDDFIKAFDVPFPTYLKLDVDGIELSILHGARQTLRDPRLRSVLVELTTSDEAEYREALAVLHECGFELTSRGADQTAAGETGCNHIFIRATTPTQRPGT